MDFEARRRLVEKVIAIYDEENRLVVVPFEDFFEGNTDNLSIGAKLSEEAHSGLAEFHRILREISKRADVQAIFIGMTELPELDNPADDDCWPAACSAYIVTSASLEDVDDWMEAFGAGMPSEGWGIKPGIRPPLSETEIKLGMRPVRVSLS